MLTFFPKLLMLLLVRNLMTKETGPQKHKRSPKIKTNSYFWTSSNHPSYVFSTNNLILDIFKWISWFADGFSIILFLAKIDAWTKSYLCKAHCVKNIFRFSLSVFFFFFMKGLQIKKSSHYKTKPTSLKCVINDVLIGGQNSMFALGCEFHALRSPIWENDTGEVSIFRPVNGSFASQKKMVKTTAYI